MLFLFCVLLSEDSIFNVYESVYVCAYENVCVYDAYFCESAYDACACGCACGVCRLLLRLRLLRLEWRKIQALPLRENGTPREVSTHGLIQVLHPNFVGRQEDERVSIDARCVAPRFEDVSSCGRGCVALVFAVRVVGRQDDEARIAVIRDV